MSTRLYLDDIRVPRTGNDWTICRSAEEAMTYCLTNGVPHFVSFDHDLGDNVPSGFDFAKWLVETDLDRPGFIPEGFAFNVHSANPVGTKNIEGLLVPYLAFRIS